jgi:UDP-N-acetylglucosamine 2-epimerase (non-hydrolysing)
MLWAPTARARDNLLAESLPAGKQIFVTGNTIIDALNWASARIKREADLARALDERLPKVASEKRMVLVTGHRRESFGEGFENICRALQTIAARSDVEIVYPVHLNPNVAEPVREFLGHLPNAHLMEPLDYLAFVRLMQRADFILTDSGGVQEEAPSLNKPVLVMRDVTERPEAIAAGAATLMGTRCDSIVAAATELLDNNDVRKQMAAAKNPYGDGLASERIVNSLLGSPVAEFDSI